MNSLAPYRKKSNTVLGHVKNYLWLLIRRFRQANEECSSFRIWIQGGANLRPNQSGVWPPQSPKGIGPPNGSAPRPMRPFCLPKRGAVNDGDNE
jgi:hypothetical protein